ncbi:Uncharacterised protein [Actinobacillus pleuropneumoniae]|nr:Uncharacterised protein [Actinobacillus pleuropneumoniae]
MKYLVTPLILPSTHITRNRDDVVETSTRINPLFRIPPTTATLFLRWSHASGQANKAESILLKTECFRTSPLIIMSKSPVTLLDASIAMKQHVLLNIPLGDC